MKAKIIAILVVAQLSFAVDAETRDEKFRRLDTDGDGEISQKEFLLGDLADPKTSPSITTDQLAKEFKELDASRDGGISLKEFTGALDGGRLVMRDGSTGTQAFEELNLASEAMFILPAEYRQARQNKTVVFHDVPEDVFKFRTENAAAQREHTGWDLIRKNVSITASGLGDKKGKGPATASWIRERTTEQGVRQNSFRWDVDAKIQGNLTGLFFDNDQPGWIPDLIARAEARIIDYNSRQADEHPGALNHLRFGLGGEWQFFNIDVNATGDDATRERLYQGSFLRAEMEYETDPTNQYRNMTGLLLLEPVLASWEPLQGKRYLAGLIQEPKLTIQPIFGVQFGSYFKEIADKVDVVPASKTVVDLGGGLESVAFLQQHSLVVTDEEIARAIVDVNASLRLNPRLFLNGEYKLVAELNRENRVFHFAKASLSYILTPLSFQTEDGNGFTLTFSYIIGQDAPTFERMDIFTAGLGIEF